MFTKLSGYNARSEVDVWYVSDLALSEFLIGQRVHPLQPAGPEDPRSISPSNPTSKRLFSIVEVKVFGEVGGQNDSSPHPIISSMLH